MLVLVDRLCCAEHNLPNQILNDPFTPHLHVRIGVLLQLEAELAAASKGRATKSPRKGSADAGIADVMCVTPLSLPRSYGRYV